MQARLTGRPEVKTRPLPEPRRPLIHAALPDGQEAARRGPRLKAQEAPDGDRAQLTGEAPETGPASPTLRKEAAPRGPAGARPRAAAPLAADDHGPVVAPLKVREATVLEDMGIARAPVMVHRDSAAAHRRRRSSMECKDHAAASWRVGRVVRSCVCFPGVGTALRREPQ